MSPLPLLISATMVLAMVVLPRQSYTVSDESTMEISGGSSMHDWSCDASVVGIMERPGDSSLPSTVSIDVPVGDIECGKGIMNKKLRKALEAKDNPLISFRLENVKLASPGTLEATGIVTAAGKTKSVGVVVEEDTTEDGTLVYSGSVDLLMTDFDIKPPTAMLGAMKTHDAITVSFSIKMIQST